MRAFLARNRFHVVVWSALAAYLVVIDAAYKNHTPTIGAPLSERLPEHALSEMTYGFDELRLAIVGSEEVYLLAGWAFPVDGSVPLDQYQRRIVLVDEERHPIAFAAEAVKWFGVNDRFPDDDRDLDLGGFSAFISPRGLEPGVYAIGLLYTDPHGLTTYGLTNMVLLRTPNRLQLQDVDRSSANPIEAFHPSDPSRSDGPVECVRLDEACQAGARLRPEHPAPGEILPATNAAGPGRVTAGPESAGRRSPGIAMALVVACA